MGGQNAKISKGFWGHPFSDGAFWQLRVGSVWVARVQGFPKVSGATLFQMEPFGSLRWGQYGWPEFKDFLAFCGGKGEREQFSLALLAA